MGLSVLSFLVLMSEDSETPVIYPVCCPLFALFRAVACLLVIIRYSLWVNTRKRQYRRHTGASEASFFVHLRFHTFSSYFVGDTVQHEVIQGDTTSAATFPMCCNPTPACGLSLFPVPVVRP